MIRVERKLPSDAERQHGAADEHRAPERIHRLHGFRRECRISCGAIRRPCGRPPCLRTTTSVHRLPRASGSPCWIIRPVASSTEDTVVQFSPPDASRKAKPKASFPPGSAPTQNALVVHDLRLQRIVGESGNKTAENPFHVEMVGAAAVLPSSWPRECANRILRRAGPGGNRFGSIPAAFAISTALTCPIMRSPSLARS